MYSLNPLFLSRKVGAPLNQDQINAIKDYVDKGFKLKEIKQLTGVSIDAIRKRIQDDNWATRQRKAGLTQAELNAIKQDWENGMTIEELAVKFCVSKENLADRIANNKWQKVSRKCKYSCDETYFDNIDDEHKAYWLGFLYADGYILSKRTRSGHGNENQSFGFSISIQDVELLEKFKQDLKSNHPINIYKNNTGFKTESSYGRILITSQHLVDNLKKYGMVENKTTIVNMPNLSPQLIPHFIRGLSDGDGSVIISHLKNGSLKYNWQLTSTKEMCQGILDFIEKPYLSLYQRFPERHVNNWTLSICGNNQVVEVLNKFYANATIYLERKYKKYVEMRGNNV